MRIPRLRFRAKANLKAAPDLLDILTIPENWGRILVQAESKNMFLLTDKGATFICAKSEGLDSLSDAEVCILFARIIHGVLDNESPGSYIRQVIRI